ncbi:hypothetical protein [Sphingomonas sp. T1]|uniref:hypothetical protein n=1 Tax=Sphingomonas sp. T1 TaxID=2653172 RepID=UPI001357F0D6|nr:hypothetical protein [Sphingomonas sp. T1]
MSTITTALRDISTHRDIVPAYYVRSADLWIITSLSKAHGGAVIVDDRGRIINAFPSKRAALRTFNAK